MAHKQIDQYITYAGLAIEKLGNKNRTLNFFKELDLTIHWQPVDAL